MLASSGIGLKLWNLETVQLVKEYPIIGSRSGELAQISNFSVKSDSTQIASVVDRDSINLLSLETQIQFDLKDSIDTKCCAYDSTGKYLATGNSNGFIEIYDVKSQALKKRTWKIENSKSVNCLSYSNNSRFIAIGNSNGSINLFNTLQNTMGKPWLHAKARTMTYLPMVNAIHYSSQSPNLASAYDDGSVILWDCSKEQPICVFQSHKSPCTSINLSPINAILMISGGLDSSFTMYDTSSKSVIRQVNCTSGITSLDILKNGWTLAAGTTNGYIHMYDLRNTGAPYISAKAHDTSVYCVKFIPNLVAPGTITANKENFKGNYLTSTINSSNTLNNDQTIKRSSSYNNQELSNIGNSPIHNIYSPEKGYNTNSTNSLNQQSANQFSTGGEFILHKKQSTSIVGLNQTPVQANSTVSNPSEFKLDLRANFAPKSHNRANEIYSPLSGNPKSFVTPNLQKNIEAFSSITTIRPTQNYQEQELTLKKQKPLQFNTQGTTHSKTEPNTPKEHPTNNTLDFNEMEIDHAETSEKCSPRTTSNKEVGQLREIIKDEIDDLRDELMSENFRFKAEMLKEFMQMRSDMKKYFELYSPNEQLINEISKLKEENSRLKKLF